MKDSFSSKLSKQLFKLGKSVGIDAEISGFIPTLNLVDRKTKEKANISYATKFSAGFDLPSAEDKDLKPGERALVDTGLKLEHAEDPTILHLSLNRLEVNLVPELQIRPKSGLAVKHGITIVNAPGTVDADYDGPIKVCLLNTSNETFTIKKGDRIAQGVIVAVIRPSSIANTGNKRADGGFGSTGK